MSIAGVENHQMYDKYPCRLPVWWGHFGDVGVKPDINGISGKKVVLRIEKKFTRFEKLLAKLFRAPREIRRPLDAKNSMLWQLCDGRRSFQDICTILDNLFHEDIAPVIHRTAAGINLLKAKNLMTVLDEEFTGKWQTNKGIIPENQVLLPLDEKLNITLGEE
ncbi:MAG TPA: hypothetical protein HA354_06495 [Candidatus Poseidoniaceae archaeon]|nr:hypothetical protein [Euryarchaeota archaeon]DAC56849.1 MAG TPA: hypothetical protein D7I07_06475 [Candidatus Poseidoniales archaeon]HII38131.1 hypothetical protein [Candidatus Poseidoniaceae archaeon]|tara:strand:+ start:152 stop:640 length:489 start_codon:yes stop_codon:yes gene_type:complete